MWCIHHIDADGFGAAAIVKNELANVFNPPKREHFIPYNHGNALKLPNEDEIGDDKEVYIVDLALDKMIFNAIKYFVNAGCKVVHIDHHKSGDAYLENLSDEDKAIYNSITSFRNTNYSGCLLTWVYSCMNEEERKHPMDVMFDFTEKFDHVAINLNDPVAFREYGVPMAIRYIDDYDVWRFALGDNTRYFHSGFRNVNMDPFNDELWMQLLYSSTEAFAMDVINRGIIVYNDTVEQNKRLLKNAFEYEINGIKCLCLNKIDGNSWVFGNKFDKYPYCIKFGYDGGIHRWRYSIYSHNNFADVADCSVIASQYFNGGGHRGAAGGVLDYNFFEKH